MTRVRRHVMALLAGAVSVSLGAATMAQAQREAPPIPPGTIPNGATGPAKEAPPKRRKSRLR